MWRRRIKVHTFASDVPQFQIKWGFLSGIDAFSSGKDVLELDDL